MAYTKEEVGTLSTASNGLLIFSSAAEVVYPTDPAYRDLYINGNKVVYKNFVVSDGGVVSVGSSSVLSGAQVYSGGVVSILSSAVLISNTIHSGGAVVIPANANPKMIISGLVLESGASLDATGNNGTAWMMNPTIAKGTLVAAPNAYTDENGTLHNYVGSKNGNWYFSGTDFDNATLTSGRLVVSNATVNTVKTNAKGYLHIGPSATVINANVTAGFIAFGTTANNGIGGSKTTITQGYVYISPTTGGTVGSATKNNDISVANGVMTGLTVRAAITGVDYIAKLRLLDGITVNAPVVDVGGSLTLSSGAKATDVSVVSGGILYVSGGEVDGGTFTDGGKLYLGSGAKIGGATLDVAAGYVYIADALAADVSVTAGTVTGLDLTDFELTLNSGLTLNGATLNDGAVLKLADDVAVTAAVTVGAGAELSGGVFADGVTLSLANGAAIGGAALTVGAGDVCFDGTQTDISVAAGVLSNLALGSGQTLTVVDGLTVAAPTVAAGGALKIGDGATLSGGTVAAGGELHILDGAVISGATVNVASGGVYLNGALDADAYIAAGKLYNFDLADMDLRVGANVLLYDGTVADGGRVVLDGGSAGLVNCTVAAGGAVSNGGYNYVTLKNVTLAEGASVKTGGGTLVLAGTENNIAKGTLVNAPDAYTDENGVVHDYRAVSAVQFQSGILVENLDVAAVTHVYAGATVRNVTQRGSWLVIAGSAVSLDNTSGGNTVLGYTANPTLGGADTNILEGTLWFSVNNTYGVNSRVLADGVAVTNGEMTGLYLVNSGKWLQKLRLVEGMSATDVVISNGGSLTIGSGGAVNGATVSTGGYLGVAAEGEARGAVVIENGGRLDGGAFAAGATLQIMGGASIGAAGWAIDSGSIYLGETLDHDAYAADGVLYNLTLNDTLNLKNLTSVADAELNDGAILNVSEGATAGGALNAGGKMDVKAGGVARDITMNGGTLTVAAGAAVEGATVNSNGILTVSNGVTYRDVVLNSSGGITFAAGAVVDHLTLQKNAGLSNSGYNNGVIIAGNDVVVNDLEVYGFALKISAGARVNNMTVHSGGSARVWNSGTVHGAVIEKGGSAWAMYKSVKVYDFTVFGGATVNSSATAYDMTVSSGGSFLLQGGFCSGAEIYDGGLLNAKYYYYSSTGASSAAYDLGAEITDLGVYTGGSAILSSGCAIHRGTIRSGGVLVVQGGGSIEGLTAGAGANVKLVYTANLPKDTAVFDTMENVTSVNMAGMVAGSSYVLTAADAATTVIKCESGIYGNGVVKGESYTNAFDGLTYSFDGTTYTVAAAAVGTMAAAGALTAAAGATGLNANDLAAKWTANTTYSTNVYLAAAMTAGDAWLDIEGFSKSANLYGAAKDQNFTGTVNINAATGSIKNLAAGAALGGSVAGVKLTVGKNMSVTGAVYAGGMGDVTGKTETLIAGGAFAGNVFAGALCNYAANQTATGAGDIDLTVDGGTFAGNIYAGAAVKAGAATGIVHTAGDITVELDGGAATKDAFCVYGGGYATGTGSNTVYTAGDVAITVAGGTWGSYASGRGIFGGVYADKVAASVESVDITVTGGTMGNVYGGGWAQNGGTSTVMGAVKITVSGTAAIDNVFGGGSYSTTGGATSVGSVYISVEGGNVANNIFACGQNQYSTVAGDVVVVFKGGKDYGCNVYGYGTPESATAAGDKTLGFVDYTGTLSGAIGGFDGIVVTGDTAATLSGANIDNGDWSFDYTGRALDATVAMLTFDGGSFTGDTVAVDFASVEQAADGWSIAAGLTAANATYSVELSTGSAANLTLDAALGDAYGIYEGWGFTLDEGTLKFKQLA